MDQDIVDISEQGSSPFAKWPKTPAENQYLFVGISQCKYCGNRYQLPCLVSMLPDKKVCERLCKVFFSTIFPLIPILHIPSFADDFRSFWNETSSKPSHANNAGLFFRKKPSFLTLLSSILFASLTSSSASQICNIIDDGAGVSARDMYFVARVSSTLTGFPRKPSLYSLAAYIISQSQFTREEEFSNSTDFINNAFRIALAMGLHRDLREAGFTAADLETRHRLWWYILHLDVMSSASSGLSPLFIDEKMANASTISLFDCQRGGLDDSSNQSKLKH